MENLQQLRDKLKRMDFIAGVIKEKTESVNELSKEVAILRKKNGRALKVDIDILIYQGNMKIASLENSISQCKEEIKKLRGEVGEMVTLNYPTADDKTRAELEKAIERAYGNKTFIVTADMAGGVEGDCDVVSAVTTKNKRKRCKISKVVRIGLKTEAGKYLIRPEIEVYDYSPKAPEGIVRSENNDFKPELLKQKKGKVYEYFSEVFSNKQGLLTSVALSSVFLAFYAIFYFIMRGMSSWTLQLNLVGFSVIVGFTLSCYLATMVVRGKMGWVADYLPLSCVAVGAIAALVCLIPTDAQNKWVFPAVIFGVGLVFTILRIIFSNQEMTREGGNFLLLGVVLGGELSYLLIDLCGFIGMTGLMSYRPQGWQITLTVINVFMASVILIFISSAVVTVIDTVKRREGISQVVTSVGCSMFACIAIFSSFYVYNNWYGILSDRQDIALIFASLAAVTAIILTVKKALEKKS